MQSDKETPTEKSADIFVVHVKFQQNATWQGNIKWTGNGKGENFRSALEMLKIMDAELNKTKPEK